MLPSTLWQKELVKTIANKRSLAVKLAFPLFLAGPVIVAMPPAQITAGAVAILAFSPASSARRWVWLTSGKRVFGNVS